MATAEILPSVAGGELADLMELLEPISVDQYHAMIEAGILQEGEPIELLDGILFREDRRDEAGSITTVGPRHASVIDRLAAQLRTKCVGRDADVRAQQPVTVSPHGEPEPDLCVIAGDMDRFNERHPGPKDVMLVIEVANQSRSRDRRLKLQFYASASIPQYWIVNLHDNLVEVDTQPQHQQGAYRQRMDHSVSDVIPFTILRTELTLAVSEFLKLPKI